MRDFSGAAGPPQPVIEFANVTIHRDGTPALVDVCLRIGEGEHTLILGLNGSGKSTRIKALTRELYPRCPDRSRVRPWGRESWHLFELRSLPGIGTNNLVQACTQPYFALETVRKGFYPSIGICPNHDLTPRWSDGPWRRYASSRLILWLPAG